MNRPSSIEILSTLLLSVAIAHTFLVGQFKTLKRKVENTRHFSGQQFLVKTLSCLAEVELVFGIWAGIFLIGMFCFQGSSDTVSFLKGLSFDEPLFVMAIIIVTASRPIMQFATLSILGISSLLSNGFTRKMGIRAQHLTYGTCLILGPLLGSLITEPAAMSVTALILYRFAFSKTGSEKLKYATIGVLFVNISIGGVLTPYAAPPVLMVAKSWGWGLSFMMKTFGLKALLAIVINAVTLITLFQKEIGTLSLPSHLAASRSAATTEARGLSPKLLSGVHLVFLFLIIIYLHNPEVFLPLLTGFIGFAWLTKKYQSPLPFKDGFGVGFFLAGLVIFGGMQRWWLELFIQNLGPLPLFLSSTLVTSVTDNAALTFLGSQVSSMTEAAKYALMSGAVAGGGLTVIANAPNPLGFSILEGSFKDAQIRPLSLFLAALFPTLVAMSCFWFLP